MKTLTCKSSFVCLKNKIFVQRRLFILTIFFNEKMILFFKLVSRLKNLCFFCPKAFGEEKTWTKGFEKHNLKIKVVGHRDIFPSDTFPTA